MATKEQLLTALRNADAAGDDKAARRFAEMIRDIDAQPVEPQPSPQPKNNETSAIGGLEAAATIGSSMIAEPVAGLAGIAKAIPDYAGPIPFLLGQMFPDKSAADVVEATRQALTYQPRTQEGQDSLQAVGEAIQPVAEALEVPARALGDTAYDLTGSPAAAAAAYTLPTAALEVAGVKGVNTGRRISNASPDAQEQAILDAGVESDVPVMTTDVAPPETYVGRFMQSLSEKLGSLGTGRARADQQMAREAAIEGLADNLDIDLDSDFAAQIVDGLNKQSAKNLADAGDMRREAVTALDQYGEVPLNNTIKEIDRQIARQNKLKDRASPEIINKLEATKTSIQGGDFSQAKDIRSEVINDLIAVRKGEDLARAETYYQPVKSAIDKDLEDFAAANDRQAAAKWKQSNKQFAEELDKTKRTELKRVLNSGTATPELVMPLLRGGKPSQLKRLYSSLNDAGKEAAKRAIIQDALKESKFFEVDTRPNPNAFTSALNKPNRQQAINVFFKGRDKAEIDGLNRLLNATRRAQDAAFVPKTGDAAILPGIAGAGGAAVGSGFIEPISALAGLTAASGVVKAYESKAFRNLLLRLKNSKKGSKQEKELLELAAAVALGGSMASREEQPAQ